MVIPVTMITDENYVMCTGVTIYSMYLNKKPETEYDIYIIMAECSEESERQIRLCENENIHITIIRKSLEEYRDIHQLQHISTAALLKFTLPDIIEKYDKFLYLDGDIYVRGDLEDLYTGDLGPNFLGGGSLAGYGFRRQKNDKFWCAAYRRKKNERKSYVRSINRNETQIRRSRQHGSADIQFSIG